MEIGLTYDDVLLVPRRSPVRSRRDITTHSRLSTRIELVVPIVSANMDTVTEHRMAITMARLGGIGIIHRFMSTDDQVEEVRKVKRAESLMIEDPEMLVVHNTVHEACLLMEKTGAGGLPVLQENGLLVGIVTSRDVLFEDDGDRSIEEVMTPRARLITAPEGTDLEKARSILHHHRIEKLLIVDEGGHFKGLITSKDIERRDRHPLATKDIKGRLRVGAAIGVRERAFERARRLVSVGVDVLVIDIAHGHSDHAIEMVKALKSEFGDSVDVVAGNVATPDGVRDLVKVGADAVKIGVGPGAACSTRIVAGAGVPQLTAVLNCAAMGREFGVSIIADGGIRHSGDLSKAMAAGAGTVMIGSLLAGTEESPGTIVVRDGRPMKVYRGMASLGASLGREQRNEVGAGAEAQDVVAEGVEALVPYRGSVEGIVTQLVGGLRSGISYAGATDIDEFQKQAEFIRITDAGRHESRPHDIGVV